MRTRHASVLVAVMLVSACSGELVVEATRDPMDPAVLQAEADGAARDWALHALSAIAVSADTAASPMVAISPGYLENPLALSAAACAFDYGADAFRCAAERDRSVRVERQYRVFIAGEPVNAVLGMVDSVQRWRSAAAADTIDAAIERRIVVRSARDSGTLTVQRNPTDRRAMFSTRADQVGSGTHTIETLQASGARRIELASAQVIDQVLHRTPEAHHPFPESGEIRVTMRGTARWTPTAGDAPAAVPLASTAIIRFLAARSALLIIGSRQCSVDLPKRQLTGCW